MEIRDSKGRFVTGSNALPPEERRRRKRACYDRWIKSKMHPCIDCGKPIFPESTRCQKCAAKYRLSNGALPTAFQGGNKHLNWKGGRQKDSGYIRVFNPTHPRANHRGCVLEHILVWEKSNGKPLPEGKVIHHLNGIKDDNRIENLVALPSKRHALVLAAKAKRIQELEAALNR